MVNGFTGSDVPLEEDILKKKVEFFQTWKEWSARNRRQIIASGGGSAGGSTTILSVGENETLFLTSVQISGWCNGAGLGVTSEVENVVITTQSGEQSIISLTFLDSEIMHSSSSTVFNMPIEIQAGSAISINHDTNSGSQVSITGWIEPKKIS